jgi:hypothetical protein
MQGEPVFEPENDALRTCSFLIISEIKPKATPSLRLTAICPDYTYLPICIASILFKSREIGALEATLLSKITEALAPATSWAFNSLTGMPIDARVSYSHDEHTVSIDVLALFDTNIGPIMVGPSTDEE